MLWIIIKTRSEVKVKVTMTQLWFATLSSQDASTQQIWNSYLKNIGDMHRTRRGTDGRTDGWTVRLLYASKSSFGGIKRNVNIQSEL